MSTVSITGKELRKLGFPEGPVISITMNVVQRNFKHANKVDVIDLLKKVIENPAEFAEDPVWQPVINRLLPPDEEEPDTVSLRSEPVPFAIFGASQIDEKAIAQLEMASRLPVAVAGALMPDGHPGYGLPIGGVLATENAVIPYGVGVDIGCRMCLSLFDIDPEDLTRKSYFFTRALQEATLFGSGRQFSELSDHAVLESHLFQEIGLLRGLQQRAWKQLGTSGSGNHFVEWGIVTVTEDLAIAGVPVGSYLGLLSHSGSRALGATIANHYTRLAIDKRKLPAVAKNLAWLMLEEEEGAEYWLSMNLAGDYASACHHIIHAKLAKQVGREPVAMVENHHNFAWKEIVNGREVIVHRKGATPAGKDVLGVIPGSMTAPGFIVKGKGEASSLSSAAHGAGRKMSRFAALNSITHEALNDVLKKNDVKLLGGGLDEAPFAYKNIWQVMALQEELVTVVGSFLPKIVRMDGTPPRFRKRKEEM